MSDVQAGGRRRIDQVLGPGFAEGLDALDMDEVRRRRDEARAELEYLSLLRRLAQGRREILRAEADRRASGGRSEPVVERLAEILSGGPRGPSRGEAPVLGVPDDEVARARRRVERLVSDAGLSNLEELSDEGIRDAVERLEAEERSVSESRTRVIDVHDTLQEEMKRRLKAQLGNPTS